MITEAYVRELRDEAKRHRLRARLLERALVRQALAVRAGIVPDAIPEHALESLSVDAECRVRGLDAALPLLSS